MSGEGNFITLPVWLFALLCVLAAWAFIGSLLLPSVRWFLRRRVNRMIDEINERLQLKIPAFKMTRRQVLIERLLYDPEVMQAAEEHAAAHNLSRDEAMARVKKYAEEIVPSFNAYAYFRAGYSAARRLAKALYRVRLGYADEEGLEKVKPGSSVVFIMNHRSNMDYVLVAFLAATKTALSYAVGEWARIWPLQTLIRSMGAYFIRRNSGDPLYRKVLATYVKTATEAGVVQAVYPEGGLSMDGRMREPKMGLISYMVRAFDPQGERDLIFIPVGINYDRVLEDRSLVRRLDPALPCHGRLFAIKTAFRFLLKNFSLMWKGKWYRLGYAGVNFGTPVSMREYTERHGVNFHALPEEDRRKETARLGLELMDAVRKVIPVLPVSMVARVFLNSRGRPLSELELKARVRELIEKLEENGAKVYIPRADRDYAVWVGLRMLTLRRMVSEQDGLYRMTEEERPLLEYYANSIEHFLE